MSKMNILSYRMRFLTPAFLGDAEQGARWRIPPIKAALRQFWRMSYAADHGFNVDMKRMRQEEGMLFGHAWLDDDTAPHGDKIAARRSLVRLRLQNPSDNHGPSWGPGTQSGVAPLPDNLSTSYAWFGLVKRGSGLKDRNAIKVESAKESTRTLQIAVPSTHADTLREVMKWVDMFATLGARSRGAWGSFELIAEDAIRLGQDALHRGAQPLEDCLTRDWPAALALDAHGLCCWESTESWATWDAAMKKVAFARKETRTTLKDIGNKDLRHALGFAGSGRMPSPLRWKLITRGEKLAARVTAIPHAIPRESGKSISASDLRRAWATAIASLDNNVLFNRFTGERKQG